MNKDRIIELAREGGLVHQWQTQGEQHDILKTLERFAALVEREVIGDAEPVGYTNEGYKGMQYANAEAYKDIRPDFIERNKLTAPLYTHPAPAVVRQLVDGLTGIIDFIEIDNLRIDQDALRIAKAALAAAKDAGL